MTHIVSSPDALTPIGVVTVDGKEVDVFATQRQQIFQEDLEQKLNDSLLGNITILHSYTVATLPTVPATGSASIFVSDESGGAVMAFSDGTNWRRSTDRAIVS